jgi:hypothetical protein
VEDCCDRHLSSVYRECPSLPSQLGSMVSSGDGAEYSRYKHASQIRMAAEHFSSAEGTGREMRTLTGDNLLPSREHSRQGR